MATAPSCTVQRHPAALKRRNVLQGSPVNLDSYRQEQPVPYPLLKTTLATAMLEGRLTIA
jgi:hypothetical protein